MAPNDYYDDEDDDEIEEEEEEEVAPKKRTKKWKVSSVLSTASIPRVRCLRTFPPEDEDEFVLTEVVFCHRTPTSQSER